MIFIILVFFAQFSFAQTVDVNNINADKDGTTTIEIHKGERKAEAPAPTVSEAKPKWEVQDGSADVDGEASATAKDAKQAWRQACADWKKEFREANRENKIVNMNCGTSSCSGEAGSKVCSSKATYKVKTRIDE